MSNTSKHVFTFWDLLACNVETAPQNTALCERNCEVSYYELSILAERIAGWMMSQGVKRGDRVGIHLMKSTFEVAAMFAVSRVGGIFVNINAELAPPQVAHIIEDCGIVVLISDSIRLKRLTITNTLGELTHILQTDHRSPVGLADSLASLTETVLIPRCPSIDTDLATLVYTSGSTGMPKGVMLTHANIVAGARSVATYLKNSTQDRVLSVMPFSFDYGLNQLTTMMLVGATLVLQAVPMAVDIIRTLRAEKVTGLGLVPTLWVDFIAALQAEGGILPELRYVTSTGGSIPEQTLNRMANLLASTDIILMYGLTESFRSTWLPPSLFLKKKGAIGVAIPNAEIYVVDEENGLCGPDEVGELLHRGALVSKGYWQQPELTAAKIQPNRHLAHLIGQESVVHSGDLVMRDQDGILWFVGRRDSLIKTSGYRVSPFEVEDMLLASGLLEEVFVLGEPHDRLGQVILAVIRPLNRDTYHENELKDWCRSNLPSYLIPQAFFPYHHPFPRTPNGKIDGSQLRLTIGQRQAVLTNLKEN